MEYVEGQPVDAYCDQHKLSVSDRLRLFRTICAAVQYAHQCLVVQGDLKPRNILVTGDGTVKLLDFGIAKLLRADDDRLAAATETLGGIRLMTPEYASPEQVKGEPITTATDTYSLGVVLYELLTGLRPYQIRSRVLHEVVRVICEEEPTRPSTAITQAMERSADGITDSSATVRVYEVREGSAGRLKRRLNGVAGATDASRA
jgi:serine/threonine protein kinase